MSLYVQSTHVFNFMCILLFTRLPIQSKRYNLSAVRHQGLRRSKFVVQAKKMRKMCAQRALIQPWKSSSVECQNVELMHCYHV